MNITKKLFFAIVVIIPYASFGMEKQKPKWDAETYDKHSASQKASAMQLLSLISIKEDADVLDLACGTGNISAKLATIVPKGTVLGTDIADSNIVLARKNHTASNLSFKTESAQNLNDGNEYDLVFFNAALHFIPKADKPQMFNNIFNALKPGGVVAIRSTQKDGDFPYKKALLAVLRSKKWLMKLTGTDDQEVQKKMLQKTQEADHSITVKEIQQLLDNAGLIGTAEAYVHRFLFENEDSFIGFVAGWLSGYKIMQRLSNDERMMFIKEANACYFENTGMSLDNIKYIVPLITAIATKPL